MNDIILTLFTPVYNRADKLKILYQSLVKQTNHSFIWLIVNDGSNDNIEEVINTFILDDKLKIQYFNQDNQGKHVAHNFGVSNCQTPYFACVDSDDTLLPNAVETILKYICDQSNLLSKTNICGIVSYRGHDEYHKIGDYPKSNAPASLSELYDLQGLSGDTFLIFKTEVIKAFPFPVFKGEKFLRESISYDLIDKQYKYLVLDKILYICEYYDDGLTKNASKLELKAPLGAALFRYHEAKKTKNLKHKFRNLTAYVFFSRIAHNENECRELLGGFYPLFWLTSFSGFIKYKNLIKGNE